MRRAAKPMAAQDEAAAPLSIHTSAGVPVPLDGFINELQRHVPWDPTTHQAPPRAYPPP